MKKYLLIFLAIAFLRILPTTPAYSQSAKCEKQAKNILKTNIDCEITIVPSSEERQAIREKTKGAITGYSCTLPLKFPKKDIYNTWILHNEIHLPQLCIHCTLETPIGNNNFNAYFQPQCIKQSTGWQCDINASGMNDLGLLGTILLNSINTDTNIKNSMSIYLNSIDQSE